MHGLTDHELALAAHGADQARLITATVSVTNYLLTHPAMPSTGRANLTFSFGMPNGTDDARVDRLAGIAAWLGIDAINRDGVFEAYKDFDGIRFGGHFTPQWAKEARARQILLGAEVAA